MVQNVMITPGSASASSTQVFTVNVQKPRDDYKFGLILTATNSTVSVRHIDKDSILALEGLQVGDIMVDMNGKQVDSAKAVSWALGNAKKGDDIALLISRPPPDERLSCASELVLRKKEMDEPFGLQLDYTDQTGELVVQTVSEELLNRVSVGDTVLLVNGKDLVEPEEVWRMWTDAEPGDFTMVMVKQLYTPPASAIALGQAI